MAFPPGWRETRRRNPIRRFASSAVLAVLGLIARRKPGPVPRAAIKRILAFRFGGIGDCIVLSGLVRSLRREWPDAHITVGTTVQCRAVFEGNPDIDEIVTGDRPVWSFRPAALLRQIRALRRWSRTPYDLTIFTQNGIRDVAMGWFVRSRYVAGFDTDRRGFDFALTHSAAKWTPVPSPDARRHVQENFHDLLRAVLGQNVPASGPRIEILPDERRWAAGWLAANGLSGAPLVIALGGTTPIKVWSTERFAEVARRAAQENGLSVVVVGGEREAALAPEFAGLGPRVRFAAGEFTLRQTFSLISQAIAVVGSDTGQVHAGAAMGVDLVAIFGPTPSYEYGYAGAGQIVLEAALDCVPCIQDFCRLLPPGRENEAAPCMAAITPDDVLAALARLLDRRVRAASP